MNDVNECRITNLERAVYQLASVLIESSGVCESTQELLRDIAEDFRSAVSDLGGDATDNYLESMDDAKGR